MPEQVAEEVRADAVLKQAIQDSQIRRIRLRSIEIRLQGEIDELKASWLTPKHAQKAAMLEAAQALVTRVRRDIEGEQERFETEMEGKDRDV